MSASRFNGTVAVEFMLEYFKAEDDINSRCNG